LETGALRNPAHSSPELTYYGKMWPLIMARGVNNDAHCLLVLGDPLGTTVQWDLDLTINLNLTVFP